VNDLYYCRVAVPETDGSEEQRARAFALAKDHAIGQVKLTLKKAGAGEWERGHHRVTMSMDSTLERDTVIAEWWPYE